MQKKWWNKTRTMVCGALFIGALTATSALAVVACGSTDGNKGPVEEKNNRPVRGFYYQYDIDKDLSKMVTMIRYIYNNNRVKDKYIEKGYSWPALENVKLKNGKPEVFGTPIPDDVFKQNYESRLDQYQNTYRSWTFELTFAITNPDIQSDIKPTGQIGFFDWQYSFDAEKYREDLLWTDDEPSFWGTNSWFVLGSLDTEWNSPLKIPERGVIDYIFSKGRNPYYTRSVDLWYIINQWQPSWPKTFDQYCHDLSYAGWEPSNWSEIMPQA